MKVQTKYILLGVGLIFVVVAMVFLWSRPQPAPGVAVVPSAAAMLATGAPLMATATTTPSPDDWTDLLDLPYDVAVSMLRGKYQETFPVMVVREGGAETMPVEPEAMYFWVDAQGIVRSYSFDEKDTRVITHGGMVRRYDAIA